jgi:hypothetical protein
VQRLTFYHTIEQGPRLWKTVVFIALHARDESSLPFNSSIAIGDMAVNIGKKL